jgi:hypothetical protein
MRAFFRLSAWLCFACACGQQAGAGPSSPHQLEGDVLDDLTGAGVASAAVSFSSDTLDMVQTATDPNGHFKLDVRVREGVEFGIVSAEHDGYDPAPARTVYFDGSSHVITLRLRAVSKVKTR